MRKVLSIVLVALMVSMMIPAMALAEETATPADYANLVAGETFTVSVPAEGATKVTVSVNAQLFNIEGVEAVNGIASADATIADGVATLAVKVKSSIPVVTATSRIKIDVDGVVSYQNAAIADRLIGDVDYLDGTNLTDAIEIMKVIAKKTPVANYKNIVANVDGSSEVDLTDAIEIMKTIAKSTGCNADIGVKFIGGGSKDATVEDPFVDEPGEPEVEEVKLNAVKELYAYYQNSKIYYAFDASANADANTTYTIKVGDVVVENTTALTGSFDYAADFVEGLEISVVASSTTENYVASDAETTTVIAADASGALAQWLTDNGLTDVAITVHEIK